MRGRTGGGKILIIDDKPASVQLLIDLLHRSGHTPHALTQSTIAMDYICAHPPDLILLDVVMPGLDGYALCEQIKANPQTQSIPIIFISGYGEVVDKVQGFNLGGADYITNPFHSQEVLARIEHQLELQRLRRDLEAQNQRLQLEVNYRLRAEAEIRLLLHSMSLRSRGAAPTNHSYQFPLSLPCARPLPRAVSRAGRKLWGVHKNCPRDQGQCL
jgi:DNA-binding response OmpR family regulator